MRNLKFLSNLELLLIVSIVTLIVLLGFSIYYLIKKKLHIVFDMDNTLTDEFGKGTRPGIIDFLNRLQTDGYKLSLWTSSTRNRAVTILDDHNLKQYFDKMVYRENYDPDRQNKPKDIRKIEGDILIDDDPRQINYVNASGRIGFLISAYRDGYDIDVIELNLLYKKIKKYNRSIKRLIKSLFKT